MPRTRFMTPPVLRRLILTLLLLACAPGAFACFLSPPKAIKSNPIAFFKRADEVLFADVISVTRLDEFRYEVKLSVSRVLKGEHQQHRTLIQDGSLSCEFLPQPGVVHLLFVRKTDNNMYSLRHIAGRDAEMVLRKLPAPKWEADQKGDVPGKIPVSSPTGPVS